MSTTNEPSILLRICTALIWGIGGFLLGGLLASWLAPKDVGLAGGAYVLFYGVLAAFLAVFLLFFLSRKASSRWLKISIAYGIGYILLMGAVLYWLAQKREQERLNRDAQQGEILSPTPSHESLSTISSESNSLPNRG